MTKKAKETAFAAWPAVLAAAVIVGDVLAWGVLPLWVWLTSVVCAVLTLVGAGVLFVFGLVSQPEP